MGILTDIRVYVLQTTAPVTVRYGASLAFEGRDLPAPQRIRIPTRHGDVRCGVSRPHPATSPTAPPPVYVHLHGGASPLLAPSVAGLPPTMLLTAEYNVLRSACDAYAARLAEAGVTAS